MKLFSFKKKKPSALKAEESKKKSGDKSGGGFLGRSTDKVDETSQPKAGRPGAGKSTGPGLESFGGATSVLIEPRVTEKATDLSADRNAYAFNVHPDATKQEIKAGIKELYNVDPVKVRIVKVPSKTVMRRRQKGVKGGGKKAYVYLKKGDSIEFV